MGCTLTSVQECVHSDQVPLVQTGVCIISHRVKDISTQPTLLIVYVRMYLSATRAIDGLDAHRFGVAVGFIISYRTSSSFDRYNEGRRYWSQIIHNSRVLSEAIWFMVPGTIACQIPASGHPDHARIL